MLETWLRTVLSERPRRPATWAVLAPAVSAARTSRSRAVSSGNGSAGGAARHERRELAGDGGADDRAAGVDAAHDVQDLVLAGALDEVAARPGPQGLDDGVVVLEHRHDDHADVRRGSGQPPRRLDAGHPGHREVHQRDVGLELERGLHSRRAVPGHADHLDVLDRGEEVAHPLAEHGVVVDDEDADHARARGGGRAAAARRRRVRRARRGRRARRPARASSAARRPPWPPAPGPGRRRRSRAPPRRRPRAARRGSGARGRGGRRWSAPRWRCGRGRARRRRAAPGARAGGRSRPRAAPAGRRARAAPRRARGPRASAGAARARSA